MAFRLFGIGSKKNSGSGSPATAAAAATASGGSDNEDSFHIVESPAAAAAAESPASSAAATGAPTAAHNSNPVPPKRQKSVPAVNYLDGVPFQVTSGAGGGSDLEGILKRVEDYDQQIRRVDWNSLDYDFNKEKAVIAQEMTATMRKVHLGP